MPRCWLLPIEPASPEQSPINTSINQVNQINELLPPLDVQQRPKKGSTYFGSPDFVFSGLSLARLWPIITTSVVEFHFKISCNSAPANERSLLSG